MRLHDMRWQRLDRSARLRALSLAVLVAGLLSAAVIYWHAVQAAPDLSDYNPENSKQFLRQMELYGGKANVLAYDLREWWKGLWHGRSLAATVAVLTVLLAAALRFAAIPLPPRPGSAAAGGRPPPAEPKG
jgi:hypothetical protein